MLRRPILYRYELVRTISGAGYTGYVLRMTSQHWRNAREVDRPVWRHWLVIVRPDRVATRTGLLIIGGGSAYPLANRARCRSAAGERFCAAVARSRMRRMRSAGKSS